MKERVREAVETGLLWLEGRGDSRYPESYLLGAALIAAGLGPSEIQDINMRIARLVSHSLGGEEGLL